MYGWLTGTMRRRWWFDHGEEFLRVYDSRYEESHGPLPLQSAKVMEKLLRCGDPHYGLRYCIAPIAKSI